MTNKKKVFGETLDLTRLLVYLSFSCFLCHRANAGSAKLLLALARCLTNLQSLMTSASCVCVCVQTQVAYN